MHNLNIQSSSGSYTACTGRDILPDMLKKELSRLSSDTLFLLVDENVQAHHGRYIEESLRPCCDTLHTMAVPPGEASKSNRFWEKTLDFLLTQGVRRNTPLLVAGGGVTGDLGGFAAATALRGIPLIHIPTTVLAMVDSSIGGKTGINHTTGKNLIGSFYQPRAVIADTRFLSSLPKREWVNGLSEILKYAAIRDEAIFDEAEIFLEKDLNTINQDELSALISKCIKIKAAIVEEDEFESGIRAFLNFGHTFAHALEKVCAFDTISHGEAVYLGMQAALTLSELTGANLQQNKLEKYNSLYQYRIAAEQLSFDDIFSAMHQDKKRTDQHIKFVLLEKWQQPVVKAVKDTELIKQAAESIFNEL